MPPTRETARIDPLPHQRIAVYERMLRQDPRRFRHAEPNARHG